MTLDGSRAPPHPPSKQQKVAAATAQASRRARRAVAGGRQCVGPTNHQLLQQGAAAPHQREAAVVGPYLQGSISGVSTGRQLLACRLRGTANKACNAAAAAMHEHCKRAPSAKGTEDVVILPADSGWHCWSGLLGERRAALGSTAGQNAEQRGKGLQHVWTAYGSTHHHPQTDTPAGSAGGALPLEGA